MVTPAEQTLRRNRSAANIQSLLSNLSFANVVARAQGIAQAWADTITPAPAVGAVNGMRAQILKGGIEQAKTFGAGYIATSGYPAVSTPPSDAAACGGGGGCTSADLFADCMVGSAGLIPACPGSLNGWCQFSGGGSATATGSSIRTDGTARILKSAVIPANVNFRARFELIEDQTEPGGDNTFYAMGVQPTVGDAVFFGFGDGGTFVVAGSSISGGGAIGVVTPMSGGHRVVDLAVDALGSPTAYMDGVPIPLTPVVIFTVLPGPDTVAFSIETLTLGGECIYLLGAWVASGDSPVPPVDCGYCC